MVKADAEATRARATERRNMAGRCRGERGKWRQHGGRKKKRFAFCAGAGAGRRGWGQRDSRTRTPTRANPGAGPRALACFRPGAPPRAPTGTLVGVRERVPGRPPVLQRCVFPVGTRTSLSETEGTRGLPAGCGGHGAPYAVPRVRRANGDAEAAGAPNGDAEAGAAPNGDVEAAGAPNGDAEATGAPSSDVEAGTAPKGDA